MKPGPAASCLCSDELAAAAPSCPCLRSACSPPVRLGTCSPASSSEMTMIWSAASVALRFDILSVVKSLSSVTLSAGSWAHFFVVHRFVVLSSDENAVRDDNPTARRPKRTRCNAEGETPPRRTFSFDLIVCRRRDHQSGTKLPAAVRAAILQTTMRSAPPHTSQQQRSLWGSLFRPPLRGRPLLRRRRSRLLFLLQRPPSRSRGTGSRPCGCPPTRCRPC